MLLDRVSNPGPLTYESGALPIALRGPAKVMSFGSYTINYLPGSSLIHCYLFQRLFYICIPRIGFLCLKETNLLYVLYF